ncbi:MAG: hypothetical protein AB9835_06060 [Eubacteriales bacterium]
MIRICDVLACNFGDSMKYVPEKMLL